jgi:hypothetical protein
MGTTVRPWGSCGADGTDPSGFCRDYLLVGDDSFEDPDGTPYSFFYAQTFTADAGTPVSDPADPADPDGGDPAGSGEGEGGGVVCVSS